jgi:tryptophan-rich sensory protein
MLTGAGVLFACFAVALAIVYIKHGGNWSAAFSVDSRADWYRRLRKPPGTPPGCVFAPVWSLLYALLALTAVLLWRASHDPRYVATPGHAERVRIATNLFYAQLGLNLLWPFLFAGLRSPRLALADLVALLGVAFLAAAAVAPVTALGAALMLPYLAWLLVALYLNAGIVVLN